ncbi:iron-sulfur cluster assembly accessory protein [Puniceicoccaceae bacterium K14]|nr:iron-sulfur cluster assembly accessory protein [Puniceicoccaceae bacterium K14]
MAVQSSTAIPEGVRQGDERLIKLSDSAVAKVRSLLEREGEDVSLLRVGVSGGGCNGLSYKMRFVSQTKRGDILVRFDDVSVIVDSKSALYLKGSHLDYSNALISGGFKFSNPNATSSCSCGESFSI